MSVTGVARAVRYSRVSQASPASPGITPACLVVLALPAICSAAVSAVCLRRGCLCLTRFILNFINFILFGYYFIPSGATSGIQRCCLATTLRISDTGVARAARYSRVSQASPASPGIPSSVAGCSGVASGMQRCCFGGLFTTKLPLPLNIYICIYILDLNVSLYRLELPAVCSAAVWRVR